MKLTLRLSQVLDSIECAGFFSTSQTWNTIVSGGSHQLNWRPFQPNRRLRYQSWRLLYHGRVYSPSTISKGNGYKLFWAAFGATKLDWSMVFKATVNQSQVHVTLVHPNDPKNHCAESLYPFFFEFVELGQEQSWYTGQNAVSPFFTLTTLLVLLEKKTVQYKDKIYANFYRKLKLYYFKKSFQANWNETKHV